MSFAKRSAAAKRGWQTRRKREAEQKRKKILMSKKDQGMQSLLKAGTQQLVEMMAAEQPDLNKPIITKWHDEGNLAQIYSSGLEYAFVNEKGEQCHPFAYCKDYLQDAVWATIHKCQVNIHGFDYKHGRNPDLDMNATRIALRLKGNKEFKEMCLKAHEFIKQIDKDQGFLPTRLYYGGAYKDGKDDVYVFIGDKMWMYSPVLISLYTLCLRVGLNYEGGDWREHFGNASKYIGSNDKSYTSSAKKALDKVIGQTPGEIFAPTIEANYPKDAPTSELHHASGIVTFANGGINAKVKQNWQNK